MAKCKALTGSAVKGLKGTEAATGNERQPTVDDRIMEVERAIRVTITMTSEVDDDRADQRHNPTH